METRKWFFPGVLIVFAAMPVAAASRFVGTISGFRAEQGEIMVTPDGGAAIPVKIRPDTLVQRIAPGEKDLQKAETIPITTVAAGDRVFVTLMPDTQEARRIVVMSAGEIARRNEADRRDWIERGVTGIVAARTPGEIRLRMRSFSGETTVNVTVDAGTKFRRYAPDSIRFADARTSSPAEIAAGDQLRARGRKSPDGRQLAAEEVVFGTFETHAGTVAAVGSGEITLSELANGQPLVVAVAADSQLKMAGGPPEGPPDLNRMLESMPPARFEDLRPGMKVLVSSTKGAATGRITAIMLLANADMLIRLAQAGGGRSRPEQNSQNGPAAGGLAGGLAGLDLTGMLP
jgi:hypothetical protein